MRAATLQTSRSVRIAKGTRESRALPGKRLHVLRSKVVCIKVLLHTCLWQKIRGGCSWSLFRVLDLKGGKSRVFEAESLLVAEPRKGVVEIKCPSLTPLALGMCKADLPC